MGAVEDSFLDVRRRQGQAQDPRGVAGAGDALGLGEFLDALVFAPGQPAVPPVGPDQGVEQGHVRLLVAVRVHRLPGGREDDLAPGDHLRLLPAVRHRQDSCSLCADRGSGPHRSPGTAADLGPGDPGPVRGRHELLVRPADPGKGRGK